MNANLAQITIRGFGLIAGQELNIDEVDYLLISQTDVLFISK